MFLTTESKIINLHKKVQKTYLEKMAYLYSLCASSSPKILKNGVGVFSKSFLPSMNYLLASIHINVSNVSTFLYFCSANVSNVQENVIFRCWQYAATDFDTLLLLFLFWRALNLFF